MKATTIERFESKFTKGNGCCEWTAYRNSKGYGQFGVNGKVKLAHRVAWELYVDLIPDGMCVLHHCDNPPCVNPTCLFLGTHADNVADRVSKGRAAGGGPCGAENGRSKLTDSQVMKIREIYSGGEASQEKLGGLFGISQPVIGDIVNRRIWKHI